MQALLAVLLVLAPATGAPAGEVHDQVCIGPAGCTEACDGVVGACECAGGVYVAATDGRHPLDLVSALAGNPDGYVMSHGPAVVGELLDCEVR